jgi:hypothetical protein
MKAVTGKIPFHFFDSEKVPVSSADEGYIVLGAHYRANRSLPFLTLPPRQKNRPVEHHGLSASCCLRERQFHNNSEECQKITKSADDNAH